MPQSVLDRASALLNLEDRRLDRMLSELAANRAMLESEVATAAQLRVESEQAREEYRDKLARLQERRDKLFGEMREELDTSFRSAHSEVARIIAELQRAPTSKHAAKARARLEDLRDETTQAQTEQGLEPEALEEESDAPPVDWPKARIGDSVRTRGGAAGTLVSLPDRKGRVSVQLGGAKVQLPSEQLRLGEGQARSQAGSPTSTRRPAPPDLLPPPRLGGLVECDLRGMRVEEALDRLDASLDLAAAAGRDELRVIHGIGTGALKRAVGEHLPRSPYVIDCMPATREDGGAGATRVILGKD